MECYERSTMPHSFYDETTELIESGQILRLTARAEQLLRENPTNGEIRSTLAHAYGLMGNVSALVRLLRESMTLYPADTSHATSYVFSLNYLDLPREDIVREQRSVMQKIDQLLLNPITPARQPLGAGRKIKVGYLSGEFRSHACSYLTLPLLAHHNKDEFDIFLYSNNQGDDDLTSVLKGFGVRRTIRNLSDEEVVAKMRHDQLDILVDLSGFTSDGRPGVFMHRPAPIQISWYGYLNSTQTRAFTHRFIDQFLVAQDQEELYSEKLIDLPRAFLYEPPYDAPAVAPSPYLKNGFVTFGALHTMNKISDRALDLWAKILHHVQGSKLLVSVGKGGDAAELLVQKLNQRGISRDRVIAEPMRTVPHYFDLFSKIDLGLDSFPYTSGVSAMHGIWMGVPVLTIEGDTELSRNCSAVNRNRGLDQFVTQTQEEFIERAVSLAQNPEELRIFRLQCRTQPVVENKAVVRAVEAAYKTILLDN